MQVTLDKKNKIIFYFLVFIFLSTVSFFEKTKVLGKNNIFSLNKIEIFGTKKIKKNMLHLELNSLLGQNLLLINLHDIENIVNKNKLIKNFTINKHYPGKISINLEEVNLIATFLKDKKQYFLTDNNRMIPYDSDLTDTSLPKVYGKNAEYYFNSFYDLLKFNNFNVNIISSYYYFQIDRWDLSINEQKTIKLPSSDLEKAIKLINELLNNENFDKYKVIDLRIKNKIITQ